MLNLKETSASHLDIAGEARRVNQRIHFPSGTSQLRARPSLESFARGLGR